MTSGYRESEVGVIPNDWRVEAVEDVALVGRGRVISHREISKSKSPTYPVYSSQTSNEGIMGYIDTFDFEGQYVTWTTDGANAGTIFAREGRFNCTNVCGTIKPRSDNYKFLAWILGRYAPGHVSRHLGNPKLMNDVMKKVKIPLPSTIEEQQAIAAALSDVDALLEELDRLIAKKRDIKQATMQQLLTGQTRMPGFHGRWCKKTLGELATFLSGGTPSKNIESYWNGDIPWISATSLRTFYIWRSENNVTKEAATSGSKMAPVGSTLLLVRGSALHKEILAGLVTKPVCFNQDIKALVPKPEILPDFLTTLLHGKAEALLRLVSSAGNTAGVLDTKLIKAFAIDLPSLEEQAAIVAVLSDMGSEIDAIESRRRKISNLKEAMMRELLTGRIRLL